jgi:hypothetical protein
VDRESAHQDGQTPHARAGSDWDDIFGDFSAPADPFPLRARFEAFDQARGRPRRMRDKGKLQDVFNAAAQSPTLAQALGWAEKNGVQFFIDEKARNCRGYYTIGAGAVALADNPERPLTLAEKAGVIVHEVRHAWQDARQLIATFFDDFSTSYRQMALYEADAMAWQSLATCEIHEAQEESALPRDAAWQEGYRRRLFRAWYEDRWKAAYYGDRAAHALGFALKVPGATDPNQTDALEFSPLARDPRHIHGIRLDERYSIMKLGADFNGQGNYLDTPDMRQFLTTTALSHPLAMRFFDAAQERQQPFAKKVQRACRTQKRRMEKGFRA